ncbi:putative mitogen-activated protein kinase CMGC-MAPK family [Helianthus anomalus]
MVSKYTTAIDIWGVGCIFTEVLMGKPLFSWKKRGSSAGAYYNLLGTPSSDTISRVCYII